MSEKIPGGQYTAPDNKPAKELGTEKNPVRENKGEHIIEGANQEDQLQKLKPDSATEQGQDSEPEQTQVDKGERPGAND